MFALVVAMAGNLDVVPVYQSLARVYGEGPLLVEAEQRYKNLKERFVELYGREPELFARAPGLISSPIPSNFLKRWEKGAYGAPGLIV